MGALLPAEVVGAERTALLLDLQLAPTIGVVGAGGAVHRELLDGALRAKGVGEGDGGGHSDRGAEEHGEDLLET